MLDKYTGTRAYLFVHKVLDIPWYLAESNTSL